MNELFTIGYSKHSLESFLAVIQKFGIDAIVDVRSVPFSKFKPDFNRDKLSTFLKTNNVEYVFLGNECGARYDDPTCYRNGKADYKLIANHKKFQDGLNRIQEGSKKYKIAIMCAEKDPINCHRMILICRNLKDTGIKIFHVLDTDEIESQFQSEKRLLKLFKLDQQELFRTEQEQLDQAYDNQSEKIAYKEEQNNNNQNNEEESNSA